MVLLMIVFIPLLTRQASQNALKGTLLEVVEEILTSAESEAKRTGNDGILVKGIISSAYPDMTFDVGEFKKFSKEDVSADNQGDGEGNTRYFSN